MDRVPSSKSSVLLVDDDPDIVLVLTDWLDERGYEIVSVGSGIEAIAFARATRFSAVILDFGLPDMSGLTVLQALRQLNAYLPVIVLTAVSTEETKRKCLEAGAYAYITKPYDTHALGATLARAIAEHRITKKLEHIERALRMSQPSERQAMLDEIPGMVWLKDCHNGIIYVNAYAARTLGRSVAEVEGQSTYALYPEEAAKYYQDDLEVIRAGKAKLGIVEVCELRSGEKRWVRTDKVPYRGPQGKIMGVLVFAEELTADPFTDQLDLGPGSLSPPPEQQAGTQSLRPLSVASFPLG